MVLKEKIIALPDEQASEVFATYLAAVMKAPLVLGFSGDIGAGKTTLIRAMLRSLGVASAIKSPTFSLVESYETLSFPIHHFDLYRIQDETELEYIGFRDYFEKDALCCIEWPEQAPTYLSMIDLSLMLSWKGDGREVRLSACSVAGDAVLSCLMGE